MPYYFSGLINRSEATPFQLADLFAELDRNKGLDLRDPNYPGMYVIRNRIISGEWAPNSFQTDGEVHQITPSGVVFEHCEFVNFRFRGYSWRNILFSNCIFRNVIFRQGVLRDSKFENCLFNITDFHIFRLYYVSFTSCEITSTTIFYTCQMATVEFLNTDLNQVWFRAKTLIPSYSREIIARILYCEAEDEEHEAVAGFILINEDMCWEDFAQSDIIHNNLGWMIKVLAPYLVHNTEYWYNEKLVEREVVDFLKEVGLDGYAV